MSKQLALTRNGYLPFDQLTERQMVFVGIISSEVEYRNLLYCGIPCSLKTDYKNSDVVSVRMDGWVKGKPGGCFPNAMILDIYYNGDVHTKIFSTNKIQFCNMPDKDTALKVINIVCDILTKANEYVCSIIKNLALFEKFSCWLLKKSFGEEFKQPNTFQLKNDYDLGNMEFGEWSTENSINWPFVAEIPDEFIQVEESFREKCSDILSKTSIPHIVLSARINALISAKPSDKHYTVNSLKICSITQRFYLGVKLDRYRFATEMEKKGYDIYFPNTTSAKVFLYIKNTSQIDTNKMLRRDISGDEKITFYPQGCVKHDGSDLDLMKKTYNNIMPDIFQIIYTQEKLNYSSAYNN